MSYETPLLRQRIQRFKGKITPIYYELVYALFTPRHVSCMNYGYAPVSPGVSQYYPCPEESLQYELYWQTYSQLERPLSEDQVLCEISSGRGGGLSFLSRMIEGKVIGLERSIFARLHSRHRFNLDVRHAAAPRLPLPDQSVDVFISIEAAHNYHTAKFVSEMFRCLKPGGFVLLTDTYNGTDQYVRDILQRRYDKVGFNIESWRDIRTNVIEAMHQDDARKGAFLRRLPFFLRDEGSAYLGMVGSHKYLEMKYDKRAYFIMKARKSENDQSRPS